MKQYFFFIKGVISIAKTNFKHLMLTKAIEETRAKRMEFMDYLKKVNILDAIYFFDKAWKAVPASGTTFQLFNFALI